MEPRRRRGFGSCRCTFARSASTRSPSPAATTPASFSSHTDEQGKVYFPDDGTVYFKADPSRYGAIKPILSGLVRERDVLSEIAGSHQVAANAWMVLLHNSRLGALHPLSTVRNAFGDRYIYSLCPSAPDAREYAVALCKDVTDNYAVSGISIETPGFLPYAHGYHHEFAMVPPNTWLHAGSGCVSATTVVRKCRGSRHRRARPSGTRAGGDRQLSRPATSTSPTTWPRRSG